VNLRVAGAASFWRPGHGAVHYGFASSLPEARADYIRQAASDAAVNLCTETWTNSRTLLWEPRIDLYQTDTAALVSQALDIAQARREAAGLGLLSGPSGARPVLVVILDLPDGPASHSARIHALLGAGRETGISVTLVVPSLDLIEGASRQLLAAGGAED